MRALPHGSCSFRGIVRLVGGLDVCVFAHGKVKVSLGEQILSEMSKDETYPSVSTSTYSQVLSSPAFPGLFLLPKPSDLEQFKAAPLIQTKVSVANKPMEIAQWTSAF